jgi:hypothetical protein
MKLGKGTIKLLVAVGATLVLAYIVLLPKAPPPVVVKRPPRGSVKHIPPLTNDPSTMRAFLGNYERWSTSPPSLKNLQ